MREALIFFSSPNSNAISYKIELNHCALLFRHILCPKCDGVGGAKDAVTKCQTCNGRGIEIFNQQIGPGMIQRIQRACSQCNGEGEVNKDPCKNCKGKKRVINIRERFPKIQKELSDSF